MGVGPIGLCIQISLLAKGFRKTYFGKYKEYGLPEGYSHFFFIRRLRSIYHSPPKNIRKFKHCNKIFEILATPKISLILYLELKKRP